MKKILFLLMATVNLSAVSTKAWLGPHYSYTRVENKAERSGGGVTAGAEAVHRSYFANIEFEGTWSRAFNVYLLDGRLGCVFCTDRFLIKPYSGFGWNRCNICELQGFHKLFVPLGFYAIYCPCSWLRGGVQFEYRFDVFSKSDCIELKNEHGLRVEIPLEYIYCRTVSVSLVPFYDWNRFGKNDERELPALTHWSAGLRVLVGVLF